MADLIIPTRQTVPNLVEGVKPPWALADQSGVKSFGAALERTAGYSADRFIDIRAGNEYNEFLGTSKAKESELQNLIEQNPYATEQQLAEWRDKTLKGIQDAAGKLTTNRARQWANRSYLSQMDAMKVHLDGVIAGQVRRQETEKFNNTVTMQVANGDYEGVKRSYELQVGNPNGIFGDVGEVDESHPLYSEMQINLAKAMDVQQKTAVAERKQLQAGAVDNVRSNLDTYFQNTENWKTKREITKEDKAKAYEMVLDQMNGYVEQGIFTPGEALLKRETLNDDIDGYAAEFMKKEKDNEAAYTTQTYTDYASRIATGQLSADEIRNSDLKEKQKSTWLAARQGAFQPAPEKSTFDGFGTTVETVMQYSADAIDKQSAIEALISDRFIDPKTNDKDYQWAVKRLEKPYSTYVAKNLRITLSNIAEQEKHWFRGKEADQGSATEKGRALIDWVDDQIEQGKSPSLKEMYGMASQLRLDKEVLVDVGQTVKRGGQDYTVIGFDTDGEPLVEPVR